MRIIERKAREREAKKKLRASKPKAAEDNGEAAKEKSIKVADEHWEDMLKMLQARAEKAEKKAAN